MASINKDKNPNPLQKLKELSNRKTKTTTKTTRSVRYKRSDGKRLFPYKNQKSGKKKKHKGKEFLEII